MCEVLRIVLRTLMRRAYNSGDWENARKYALKDYRYPERRKVGKKRSITFVLESKDLLKLEICLDKWSSDEHEYIRDIRARTNTGNSSDTVIPSPNFEIDWNPTDIAG